MRLNIGDSMFLGQHLLYDKIINKKTTYNQRWLDTFQELGAKTSVLSEFRLITICLPKLPLQFQLGTFFFTASCLKPAAACHLIIAGFRLRGDCA